MKVKRRWAYRMMDKKTVGRQNEKKRTVGIQNDGQKEQCSERMRTKNSGQTQNNGQENSEQTE